MPYTVQSGDTFWSVSQKLGISVEALDAANPGVRAENLQVGQALNTTGSGGSSSKHTIAQGDTLWAIAHKFGTSVDALHAANPGVNPSALQVGQVINVPAGTSNGGGGGGMVDQSHPPNKGGSYVPYSGPASRFPDPKTWASWRTLWPLNERLMRLNSSKSEVALIKSSIKRVAKESGIDRRAICVIITQESGGNVRVRTTNNGVRNPGLMQSHNGVEFNPADPACSILQMIRDGTEGTASGDGLKQLLAKYGNYYAAFRAYNSGSIIASNLSAANGATADYVSDAANRLMGHTWPGI